MLQGFISPVRIANVDIERQKICTVQFETFLQLRCNVHSLANFHRLVVGAIEYQCGMIEYSCFPQSEMGESIILRQSLNVSVIPAVLVLPHCLIGNEIV